MTGQLPIPTARETTELHDRIKGLCLRWLNRAANQKAGTASYRQGVADALNSAAAELAGEIGETP
jgi:hypothetical protein